MGREPGRERESRRTLCVLDPRDSARAAPSPGPAPNITAMREDIVVVINGGMEHRRSKEVRKWVTSLQRPVGDVYTHESFKR